MLLSLGTATSIGALPRDPAWVNLHQPRRRLPLTREPPAPTWSRCFPTLDQSRGCEGPREHLTPGCCSHPAGLGRELHPPSPPTMRWFVSLRQWPLQNPGQFVPPVGNLGVGLRSARDWPYPLEVFDRDPLPGAPPLLVVPDWSFCSYHSASCLCPSGMAIFSLSWSAISQSESNIKRN